MQKIMFNDRFLLTQAVLEGRKKETRRFVPKEVFSLSWDVEETFESPKTIYVEDEYGDFNDIRNTRFAQYKKGEIVSIAQSYKNAGIDPYYKIYNERTKEYDNACDTAGWTNKMFVKAELMPSRIEITNVRLQQLKDITDDECFLEGVKEEQKRGIYRYSLYDAKPNMYLRYNSPRGAYAYLIDAISGKGTWDSNPYVFAYDFELVK